MESKNDKNSEAGDAEDLPSDFFDDFSKDDFINGLSVIDSWDDDETNSRRKINTETLDSVKDLRELIGDGKVEDRAKNQAGEFVQFDKRFKWRKDESSPVHSGNESHLDIIKPGSRRDLDKTNEAIKKDKESKVKEYLAKHLESSDDLRPPGTELDDYYTGRKTSDKRKSPSLESRPRRRSKDRVRDRRRESPIRQHKSPHRAIRRSPRYNKMPSPRRNYRRSPARNVEYFSPPRKYRRQSPHWSPRRQSPLHRSSRRMRHSRSRSPMRRRSYGSNSPHRQSSQHRDSFLYPPNSDPYSAVGTSYEMPPYPSQYPVVGPEYTYSQVQPYAGYSDLGYEYGTQLDTPVISIPQPVPAPALGLEQPPLTSINPLISASEIPPLMMNTGPVMVPAPSPLIPPSVTSTTAKDGLQPYDALAQLVADGKLSKEDYLKLAPNKGIGNNMDPKTRVMVLSRCNHALSKLSQLMLPRRLLLNNSIIGQEPKSLKPKYCSPLKRQTAVEFQFTNANSSTVQQNKQLVDSIITTIGLEKLVARPKKKVSKDVKDAAVQTSRPHCEMCEIREATQFEEISTATDPQYFTTSIHTQVVEQDLISSKSIFNPTGSASDNAPMSIAHMTPAQLVSQLAARAKTLKQSEPVQTPGNFNRRNPPSNYDRGGQYNYNYRY